MWSGCDLHQALTLVASFARTEGGRKGVLSQDTFLSDGEILERHARLEALEEVDLPAWTSIAEKIAFTLMRERDDLPVEEGFACALLQAFNDAAGLRKHLAAARQESLKAWVEPLDSFEDLLQTWLPRFTASGELKIKAFPHLVQLSREVNRSHGELNRAMADALKRYDAFLQDGVVAFRDERHCLQVKSTLQSRVPGLFMGSSSSGASVFIEPMEVVQANNAYLKARETLEREKRTIILSLYGEILTMRDEMAAWLEFLTDLDIHLAFLTFKREAEGILPPPGSMDDPLVIEGGRHPLLDERMAHVRQACFRGAPQKEKIVPMRFSWPVVQPILILSGPNGGGKTVALKTTALIVILARMGWPVPAGRGTLIPPFNRIMLHVGDEQDVLKDLSTFTSSMTRLKEMLRLADEKSLLFIDEAGFGTDPGEGAALAQAILLAVRRIGARAFITTHLTPLKMLPLSHQEMVNASMTFDKTTLTPTYSLTMGLPGSSHALEVARAVGLPDEILDDAESFLGEKAREREDLLTTLQVMTTRCKEERQSLAKARERYAFRDAEREREWHREVEHLKEEIKRWRRETREHLMEKIAALREEGITVGRKREARLKEVLAETPAVLHESPQPQTIQPAVGMSVALEGFAARGTIREIAPSGTIRVEVEGKQLWLDASRVHPSEEVKPLPSAPTVTIPAGDTTQVNVVGHDIESAMDEVESAMDRALLTGQNTLLIIHGHGTGKLRKALRNYLKKQTIVKGLRPTHDNGATEVEL